MGCQHANVAQSAEQRIRNAQVVGSTPTVGSIPREAE